MNDPKAELNRRITTALAPLIVNGVLPQNAILQVLDPVIHFWEDYATGGDASWFAEVIDTDAIVEVYRGARLISHNDTILLDYRW